MINILSIAMAVPYDEDDQQRQQRGNVYGHSASSQPQSPNNQGASTPITQIPSLPNPTMYSSEDVKRLFCEAVDRCSVGGLLSFPSLPPSPSCSSAHSIGSFGHFIFPRTPPSSRTSWPNHRRSRCISQRSRLNSSGYEDEENDDDDDGNHNTGEIGSDDLDQNPSNDYEYLNFEEHIAYMEAREQLAEFPGRIPLARKKQSNKHIKPNGANNSMTKRNDLKFAWPTVVTAVVLAMGCGYLVTR